MFILSFYDFPEPLQFLFQDPASATMYFIIGAHNTIMFYLFIIVSVVIVLMYHIVVQAQSIKFSLFSINNSWCTLFTTTNSKKLVSLNFVSNRLQKWNEENTSETFWTGYPTFLIIILVFPVLIFLFAFEEVEITQWNLIVKVIGNQWFWSYELLLNLGENESNSIFSASSLVTSPRLINFESRLISDDDITIDGLRLLEVDNSLVLPVNFPIHVYVTSVDVIHSWAVPSLGIKIDAVPGRINSVSFIISRPGEFYGQCSELCGVNHFAMPIRIIGLYFDFFNI
jgi:cytochrome c oxidase subunit 2